MLRRVDTKLMRWSNPFPTGTDLVKCVLYEAEDMSSKSDFGDIYLNTRIRNPVGGTCSTFGTQQASRLDSSYDIKHMVAYEDTETDLDNKCLEVEVNVQHVAASSINVNLFCYYSGTVDDMPN